MGEWTQSHLNTLLPSAFWLVHLCLCVFVCCTVEVRYDRLEAKLQAQFSRAPGASTVQSRPCQEIWNRHRNRGYLTRLKESDGTRHWKDGKEWEVSDKGREADKVIDIRLSEDFGVPSILSSGFSGLVQQTLFSHNTGRALERTHSLRD